MSRNIERPPSYLSVASLARELDVSETTVYDMVKREVLPPPIRLSNGCVRWCWAEVQAALASRSSGGSSANDDPFLAGVRNATSAA
jgi:predicted DNA-binding transcriptional regulator AlpA